MDAVDICPMCGCRAWECGLGCPVEMVREDERKRLLVLLADAIMADTAGPCASIFGVDNAVMIESPAEVRKAEVKGRALPTPRVAGDGRSGVPDDTQTNQTGA